MLPFPRHHARPLGGVAVLLLAACGSAPATSTAPMPEMPEAPLPNPPGVTLRVEPERAPFPTLASTCTAAQSDQRRAEALLLEPFPNAGALDLTAAQRQDAAHRMQRLRYGVQNDTVAWLVDTSHMTRSQRFERRRLVVSLRRSVTLEAMEPAFRALEIRQWGRTGNPPAVAALLVELRVLPGSERATFQALLWDCRVRFVTLVVTNLSGGLASR